MSVKKPINVALCWHMHQPQYCDVTTGVYEQPWTYLHAIKDYVDMAAHIARVDDARAVVNFAPVLLEQIQDYAGQVETFLEKGEGIRDPFLNALAMTVMPNDRETQLRLMRNCLRANEHRLIDRFPPFRQLADMAKWFIDHPTALAYLNENFLVDLVVWYHLAWIGETVRRSDRRIRSLEEKARNFTLHDRRQLLQIIGELLNGIIPAYRRLHEEGKVELSMTPYAHPIMPLLLDIKSAREAMPDAPLPAVVEYPGGKARAEWHVREGYRYFEKAFGFRPQGCWPAEGSVSTATLKLLEKHGFHWAASGETVLFNSLAKEDCDAPCREDALFHPYHVPGGRLGCFFRDDGLSDLIGFTYSDWHADDAVANFIHHLETIHQHLEAPEEHVVTVFLDGENAWEYYPENGYYFLSALYERLARHEKINLTTLGACIENGVKLLPLEQLVAGSWVYGTFSTWIGDKDKNRGWEMLVEAKQVFDRVVATGRLTPEQIRDAERQLAICEGSDWFWWFGDYNPSDSVKDFDNLFRKQLANLYEKLGEEPPDYLAHAFSFGTGASDMARGGVMRHGKS